MSDLKEYLPITIVLFIFVQFSLASILQRRRLKRIDKDTLVCPKCSASGVTNPRMTSLGSLKFTCMSCNKNFTLQLPKGLKVSYLILCLLMIVQFLIVFPVIVSFR